MLFWGSLGLGVKVPARVPGPKKRPMLQGVKEVLGFCFSPWCFCQSRLLWVLCLCEEGIALASCFLRGAGAQIHSLLVCGLAGCLAVLGAAMFVVVAAWRCEGSW